MYIQRYGTSINAQSDRFCSPRGLCSLSHCSLQMTWPSFPKTRMSIRAWVMWWMPSPWPGTVWRGNVHWSASVGLRYVPVSCSGVVWSVLSLTQQLLYFNLFTFVLKPQPFWCNIYQWSSGMCQFHVLMLCDLCHPWNSNVYISVWSLLSIKTKPLEH